MPSPLNPLHLCLPPKTRLALAAACLSAVGSLAGCDNPADRADRAVDQQVQESRSSAGPRGDELPAVPTSLTSAAGNSGASPAARAEALAWLGQSEVQRAATLMSRADHDEIAARRLLADVTRLNSRLQSNAGVVAGLQKLEPSKERAALQERRGAIQGEQDPVWVKHETGPLPALKGVEERVASLQEEIGKLEQQSKDLAGQRSRLVAEAERLNTQSEGAQGKESVTLFQQSSEARKKAADLGVQADALESKLLPLRQDLQLAQGEQQLLAKAVEGFDARLQGSESNWKTVQQQIEAMGALSRTLIGPAPSEPAAPPAEAAAAPESGGDEPAAPATKPAGGGAVQPASLVGKLRWLSAYAKRVEAQRSEAEGLLTSALGHYKSAGDAADTLSRSLAQQINASGAAQRPERPSWERLTELYNPSEFKLKQAAVHLMLAGLQRDRASLLAARASAAKSLAPTFQAAKAAVPPELAENNVEGEVAAARSAAQQSYKEADTLLTDVVETKSNDAMTRAARAAHALRLAGLYGQAQLAAATDPKAGAQLMAQAKQMATQAEGSDLPAASALPGFIQDVLDLRVAPTTAPVRPPAPGTVAPPVAAPTPTPKTPAPTTGTPAPAPDAVQPPAAAEPAPGVEQPAPGAETPAPAPTTPDGSQPAPAPEGAQPEAAPAGDAAAPAPAPDGGAAPAPAPDAGAAPAPAPTPDAGAPPAPAEQPPAGEK